MAEKVDVSKLTAQEIETLSPDALRTALKSVIRDPGASLMHRNHNSHSNVNNMASQLENVTRGQ